MEVKSGRLKLQCNLDRAGFVQCCREHLSGWPCKSALIPRWKSKVSYFVYIYLFPQLGAGPQFVDADSINKKIAQRFSLFLGGGGGGAETLLPQFKYSLNIVDP